MTRLLADEDVAFPVVKRLQQLGHDVVTLLDLELANVCTMPTRITLGSLSVP